MAQEKRTAVPKAGRTPVTGKNGIRYDSGDFEKEEDIMPFEGEQDGAYQASPFLMIQYDHAEKPLSREEAARLAQLGMFYENKYKNKLGKLDEAEKLNLYANQKGFGSINDYVDMMESQGLEEIPDVDELTYAFTGNGMNEMAAQALAKAVVREIEGENLKKLNRTRELRENYLSSLKEKTSKKVADLFPEFMNEVPKDFMEKYNPKIESGELNYYEAALEHKISRLQDELSTLKAQKAADEENSANAAFAPGDIKGRTTKKSRYSPEELDRLDRQTLKKMSPQEFKRVLESISKR